MYIEEENKNGILPKPIKLVLETYEDVNKLYAIFNNCQILDALDIGDNFSERIRESIRSKTNVVSQLEYNQALLASFRQYNNEI